MTPEDTAAASAPATAAQQEAVLARVAYLFRRAGSDVTMQALLRAMIDYRKEGQ
jgi:hypothetical protein